MAAPRPGNHDRGWNDPPMFLYNTETQSQKTPQKRHLLNKRVAYPLQPSGESPEKTQNAGPDEATNTLLNTSLPPAGNMLLLPPTVQSTLPSHNEQTVPLLIPQMPNIENCDTSGTDTNKTDFKLETNAAKLNKDVTASALSLEKIDIADDKELLQFCQSELSKVLERCISSGLQKRVSDDIKKRFVILDTYWTSNKLSQSVKDSTAQLARALVKNQCNDAMSIQVSLMVDYVGEVSQWMVGIKRLIQEYEKISEKFQDTNNSISQTHETEQTDKSTEAITESEGNPPEKTELGAGESVGEIGVKNKELLQDELTENKSDIEENSSQTENVQS